MAFARLKFKGRTLWGGLALLLALFPTAVVLADPSFTTDSFKGKWQRADKPVNDGATARSWLWGPEAFNPPNSSQEAYAESPGGTRKVQYFDKARMELNDPANGIVTNGLLVRELISGKLAIGNSVVLKRRPADDIPAAGDLSGNEGPTYFSFFSVATLSGDHTAADRTGEAVIETLNKAGAVGITTAPRTKTSYVYFDQNLKHNIPDVFWNFMNERGTVYLDGQLVKDRPVLGEDPVLPWLDATGLPLTEAYWTKYTVNGEIKDILVQAFERRILTFTPDNSPPFQVEMGNVGRHYFNWRYNNEYDRVRLPIPGPIVTPPPVVINNNSCLGVKEESTSLAPSGGCTPPLMRPDVINFTNFTNFAGE